MSRMGKTGTAVLTSLFMSLAAPAGATPATSAAPEPPDPAQSFPACFDDQGAPARYLNEDENEIRPGTVYAGARYAGTDPITGPVILYDPDFLTGLSQIGRDFTFAHECYHLSSGDARMVYEQIVRTGDDELPEGEEERIERAADCDAARRMRDEYGYSAQDMATLENVIRETTPGRKAEDARFAHIMACYSAQP